MINNSMEKITKKVEGTGSKSATAKVGKPNEQGGFHFSSHIKITEVDTGKVILHKRCN